MSTALPMDKRKQLLNLPNEIISHIFHCLDTPSPFLQASLQQPSPLAGRSLFITPLKQASLLSRRLRKLASPQLFKHIFLNPSHLKSLLVFLSSHNLGVHVDTVVAYLPSPCSHYHPPWWSQLLSQLPKLTSLSILAPPHIFSEVTETNTRSRDIWAFNMPYQILQLQCLPPHLTPDQPHSGDSHALADRSLPQHILFARPWTSILINESSSLKAYTTWEYWLRSTPSPIYSLNSPTRFRPFISNLLSFSLVAIFPTYSHIDHVLQVIKQMHRLQTLFLKLIPDPDSTILNDEIEEAKGHLDVNDPWNEHQTSLSLAAAACLYLSKRKDEETNDWDLPRLGLLRELRIDDVKMLGVRDTIEDTVTNHLNQQPDLGWGYEGEGLWTRDPKKVGVS